MAKSTAMNPTAVSPADLARLLTAAGGVRVEAEQIRDDIDGGAPTNDDGTVNVVHYAAWLVRSLSTNRRSEHGGD